MKSNWQWAALLFLIVLTIATSVSQTSSHSHAGTRSNNPDWSELQASMEKMHTVMSSVKESDNSDTDFVRLMLPHHQAAIDMAKTQLLHGADPQMSRLAQEIIADQQSEIELMQLWMKQHSHHTTETNAAAAFQKGE